MPLTTHPTRYLFRASARPTGLVLIGLAICMAVCAAAGPASGAPASGLPLLASAALAAAVGGALRALGQGDELRIGRREALVIVASSWIAAGVFGALPFLFGASLSPWDALFESVSGFTTTGATILPEIEQRLSPPLHLWRMATHWLGGLGIVVLFVALFPALGVGGKHLFRTESAGPQAEGLAPRIRETAAVMWKVYATLTAVLVVLLLLAGMPGLDALAHAFSTLGTGGFSSRNASIAGYQSLAIEIIVTVFMVAAGTNMGLFYDAWRRGPRAFLQNAEFKAYLSMFLGASLLVTLSLWGGTHETLGDALRYASFQVASIMTTTGFGTDDYERWPAFAQVVLGALFFFGGCAGSTAGGMKVIRLLIIIQALRGEVRRGYRPTLVTPVRVGSQVVQPHVVSETLAFLAIFMLTLLAGTLAVALFDPVDPLTAFFASLACLTNVGPGLGLVGPTENFGFLSPASKLLLTAVMLLGRLEFFTLLALLVPSFWRR